MDLLDFEAQGLYFEEPEVAGVKELIAEASDNYASGTAEMPLLRAYFLAPNSLNVLVALNRFYYYQHRLEDALIATNKALAVIRPLITFPEQWQDVELKHITETPAQLLTQVRLYLFTLKAIGFLHLRLGEFDVSRSIFEKLVSLDSKDRIGAAPLLELAIRTQAEQQNSDNLTGKLKEFG